MIKRIKDSDRFICNVISVTGKKLDDKTKIFNTFEEACEYRRQQLRLKTVEDVEIYSEEKNILPYACEDSEEEVLKETCCICGGELGEYGNNPFPISEEGECCDECNEKYVLPARILKHFKPYKADLFIKCKSCGMPVVLAEEKNTCSCGKCYNESGKAVECNDSFEEISKAMKQSNKPLKHKKLKISTETARKIAQSTTLADARGYIGEYFDEFYERYRGITVYRKEIKTNEYVYVAEFLDTEYVENTIDELEKKLDKEIEKYIDAYKNDFEIKEIKEINRDLTKKEE